MALEGKNRVRACNVKEYVCRRRSRFGVYIFACVRVGYLVVGMCDSMCDSMCDRGS